MKNKSFKNSYLEGEKQYKNNGDFELFKKYYLLLKNDYTLEQRGEMRDWFYDLLVYEGRFNEALIEWKSLREEEWDGWNRGITYRDSEVYNIMKFERLLSKSLIDGYFIEKIAFKGNQLTSFGKRNKKSIFKIISQNIQVNYKESFFEVFFKNYSLRLTTKNTFPLEHYKKYFSRKSWDWYTTNPEGIKYAFANHKNGRASAELVLRCIREESSRLLRDAENTYRISIGAKKVGESWIGETELYYKIKSAFPNIEVIQHGRPTWLGRQHLDVWIPMLNVAIEYQGLQHDKAIDFFGGEKAFEQNLKRDQLKKRKCFENNVTLIEVREGYDLKEIINKIKQISSWIAL
jgi:hypothetical protein